MAKKFRELSVRELLVKKVGAQKADQILQSIQDAIDKELSGSDLENAVSDAFTKASVQDQDTLLAVTRMAKMVNP